MRNETGTLVREFDTENDEHVKVYANESGMFYTYDVHAAWCNHHEDECTCGRQIEPSTEIKYFDQIIWSPEDGCFHTQVTLANGTVVYDVESLYDRLSAHGEAEALAELMNYLHNNDMLK